MTLSKVLFKTTTHQVAVALAIIRIGIGLTFIFHGYPKIIAGPERWQELGARLTLFGIDFLPVVWGFLCSVSEFVGGIALTVGIFVRPFSFMLLVTMTVAFAYLLSQEAPYADYSHPLKLVFIFLALLVSGPDRYSTDSILTRRPWKDDASSKGTTK